MKKKCLECGVLVAGRSDKKFCSDQCRTSYHNRRQLSERKNFQAVNRVLKKNRAILARLNPSGKTIVSRKRLIAAGFNFSYLTSIYTTKAGKNYYFCYEQGYVPAGQQNYYKLVWKKDYAG